MEEPKFFLRLRTIGALMAVGSLVGCFSTGDDDGNESSAFGGNACERYCSWAASCGVAGSCEADCGQVYALGGACRTAIDQLASCVQANQTCGSSACSSQGNAVANC